MSREKGHQRNFDQKCLFCYIFWMHITLRWICESLSRIAVKISFLWCRKHCVYAAVSFAAIVTLWHLRNVMQKFTSDIFHMTIICNAQWLFSANLEIWDFSSDFTRRQNFLNKRALSSKPVSIFYRENMRWIWGEFGCLMSHLTIFQSYMWRHIDVQADWRSWTYARAKICRNFSITSQLR